MRIQHAIQQRGAAPRLADDKDRPGVEALTAIPVQPCLVKRRGKGVEQLAVPLVVPFNQLPFCRGTGRPGRKRAVPVAEVLEFLADRIVEVGGVRRGRG